MVARSCNVGLVPVVKAGDPALGRAPADRGGEGLLPRRGHRRGLRRTWSTAQAGIDITCGLGRRAGRLRRRAAVRGPGPLPVRAAVTRSTSGSRQAAQGRHLADAVSDKVMGLGGLLVPGTHAGLAVHPGRHPPPGRQAEHPEIITTDQGSYSDIVYGMFADLRLPVRAPASPTSPIPSCGGSTPPMWTAGAHHAVGQGASGWGDFSDAGAAAGQPRRRSCSTGTTCSGSPGLWPPARSAPTT